MEIGTSRDWPGEEEEKEYHLRKPWSLLVTCKEQQQNWITGGGALVFCQLNLLYLSLTLPLLL